MPRRAVERERDRVAEVLHQAQGDGRLSFAEYSDRLDRAFAAQKRGDLAPLTADLGVHGRTAARGRPKDARVLLRAAWFGWAMVAIFSLLILPIMSVMTGDPIAFWPAWITLPWLLILVAWTLLGPRRRRRG